IEGTPCEVPLPSTVTLRLNNPLPAAGHLDKPQAQLIQHLLEDLPFFGREVAACLLIEKREDFDHLGGAFEILRADGARDGIGQGAEMNRRGARQREHEPGEAERRRVRLIRHRDSFYRAARSSWGTRPATPSRASLTSWPRCAGRMAVLGIASRA